MMFDVINPQLTVGLPFYNNEDTLRSAIQSVFAQSFSNWELILLDDGSSDGSLDITGNIEDVRVTTISDGMNRGLAYRLNQITSLAKGEYVARMDADDMMHPERLARQLSYLKENPEIDLVSTAAFIIDQNSNVSGLRGDTQPEWQHHNVLSNKMILHSSVTASTEWFRRNPYNADYIRAEDHELWCRTFGSSSFAHLTDPLLFYREGKINVTDYLATCRADRRIYKTYGAAHAGKRRTLSLVAGTYLKGFVYQAFGLFNRTDFLASKRNRRLSAREKAYAESVVETIRTTAIPGL